jgi:cytochrome b involved in lipid metabolism
MYVWIDVWMIYFLRPFQHNTMDDCWIVIEESVYDISDFLSEHPGGAEILMEYAGKSF